MHRIPSVRCFRSLAVSPGIFVWAILSVLACGVPALGQSQQPLAVPGPQASPPAAPATTTERPSDERLTGSISGIIADQTGSAVIGAHVTLAREDRSPIQEVVSGDHGEFSFPDLPPGPFHLTIAAAAFASQTVSGILHAGEIQTVPQIVLAVAAVVTEVKVTPPRAEMAKYQLEIQEKQRVLGFIPNFYVTYFADTVPLTPKQKFHLTVKTMTDPVTFAGVGVVAGVEQGLNNYSGYGQGAEGYAKRFGAAYADLVISNFIGSAALPALLKQDPRYFYKGNGNVVFRFVYAIANSVICKGDNGHWQANYSKILGDFASGGISNLYYPQLSRGGFKLAYENAAIAAGITATANLINEFLIPKLPSRLSGRHSGNP